MIIHVDMDAFYASIEQREHPELQGKPVVVGGLHGRGVVSTASYEARRYGIHSAMSGAVARRLCPNAHFVRGNISYYAEVGRAIREIFHRYTPIVQPLSLDEAFLDVTKTAHLFGGARRVGELIRDDIQREIHLPASVGIAPIKFLAKIASDFKKPNGFVYIDAHEVDEFLSQLSVQRLWGVGDVMKSKLEKVGIRTVNDIRRLGRDFMASIFGAHGIHLWELANGIDDREVVVDYDAKSIGNERTFHEDIADETLLDSVAMYLVEQTCYRLRTAERNAKCVGVKYRLHDFKTYSKNATLSEPTSSTESVAQVVRDLLRQLREKHPLPVRLLGVSVERLSGGRSVRQMTLFDEPNIERSQSLDCLSDQLQKRFGGNVGYRATSHEWKSQKRMTLGEGE